MNRRNVHESTVDLHGQRDADEHRTIAELNAHILNELIEKIVVHEKQVDEDGVKSQAVDIYYKFIGYVNMRKLLENGVWCKQETPEGQRPVLVKPA